MCEFVSWCIHKGTVYFLDDEKLSSRRGKELQAFDPIPENWKGHGAICWFYGFERASVTSLECTDFSSPENFPPQISEAIRACKFTSFGVPMFPKQLLKPKALAEYEKIRGAALAEYAKIRGPALAEYEKIRGAARAEYRKIRGAAWAEYLKIQDAAWAEYEKTKAKAFWTLFANPENRTEIWKNKKMKVKIEKVVNPGRTKYGTVFCRIKFVDGNLSITGVEGPRKNGNCSGSCGQIQDTLGTLETFADGWSPELAQKFKGVWDRWHLNDMQSACEHQRELGWTYQEHHDPKTFKGDLCPVCGYSIGSKWLREEVPTEVIEFLESLPESKLKPAWV